MEEGKRGFITQDEFAKEFGVTRRTVQRYVRDGAIRAVRLGPRLVRIPRDELDRLRSAAEVA